MADQNITALPQTTTPETSDQLLIVGATEEKLIDYEKLADAILAKLTSKTFALNQGTMTLLQALNELNSKAKIVKYSEVTALEVQEWNENAIGFVMRGTYGDFQLLINPTSSSLKVYKK